MCRCRRRASLQGFNPISIIIDFTQLTAAAKGITSSTGSITIKFVRVCYFGCIYLELIFSSKIFNYCFNECSAALFCSARRFHFVLLRTLLFPILESSSPRKEELTLGPSTSSCGCACSRAGSQWGRRRRWPGSGRRCTSSRRRARSGR